MNVYDSQVAAGILEKAGFEVVFEGDADGSARAGGGRPCISKGAAVVLMNTCSVREHAEERVWGRLGMLGQEKKERPELVIGLMGCMVEEHRENLFKRFPYLDLMVGTRNIAQLPQMIRQVLETRQKLAQIRRDGISIEYRESTKRDSPYHAWLPIMTGCDKVCTFCIVPITRGREVSMPAEEVVKEARRLVANGVRWITLLGQNVNSYGSSELGVQSPEPQTGSLRTPNPELRTNVAFPKLLEMLCAIDGLERISFTTSHPSDATEELFQSIARYPKISRRFHLPLQSGSDRVLKRMKRLHTYADFKAKIDRLRERVPDISVTTDIIAGFPGETDEDYQATWRALEEIRFDGAFIYKYSVRPGTPAAKLMDDVPLDVKVRRNNELLTMQRAITEERNRRLIGRTVTAFVEKKGVSHFFPENAKNERPHYAARTDQDKRVIVSSKEDILGRFVNVKLLDLRRETFLGQLIWP